MSITKISNGFFVCINKDYKQLFRCFALLYVGITIEKFIIYKFLVKYYSLVLIIIKIGLFGIIKIKDNNKGVKFPITDMIIIDERIKDK